MFEIEGKLFESEKTDNMKKYWKKNGKCVEMNHEIKGLEMHATKIAKMTEIKMNSMKNQQKSQTIWFRRKKSGKTGINHLN